MLRAGPLSDERVIGLLNRRFVALYFDLSDRGAAADPAARKFVVAARPRLGGRAVPTPPLLIMTPDGKVVGETSNYSSTAQVLSMLLAALEDHPEYNKPSPAEQAAATPLERARIQLNLQDLEGARKTLARDQSAEAHYLLGHIARLQKRWGSMGKHFALVKDDSLKDDVRMERAYELWYAKKHKELAEHLKDFPKESNRYTEARYYQGLAAYHGGDKEQAQQLWEVTVKSCSQDPWIYRADWAYTGLKQGPRTMVSSAGKRVSLLNRIGYMGRRNPDLQGPK